MKKSTLINMLILFGLDVIVVFSGSLKSFSWENLSWSQNKLWNEPFLYTVRSCLISANYLNWEALLEEVKEVIALGSFGHLWRHHDIIMTSFFDLWRQVNEAQSLTTFVDIVITCKEATKI